MKQSDDILISLTHMIKHFLEQNYIVCGQFVNAFSNRDKLLRGQVDVWAMGVIMYGLVSGCGLRKERWPRLSMGDLGVSNFDIYMIIYLGKIPVTAWAVLEFFFGFPKGVRLVVARSTFSLRCLWLSHFLSSFLSAFFHALLWTGEFHTVTPCFRTKKTWNVGRLVQKLY